MTVNFVLMTFLVKVINNWPSLVMVSPEFRWGVRTEATGSPRGAGEAGDSPAAAGVRCFLGLRDQSVILRPLKATALLPLKATALLLPHSLCCPLSHVAFLPEPPPGRRLSLKTCQRQEGPGPAPARTAQHSSPGSGLVALPTVLPSLAAAAQTPNTPLTPARGCEASLGRFTCGRWLRAALSELRV